MSVPYPHHRIIAIYIPITERGLQMKFKFDNIFIETKYCDQDQVIVQCNMTFKPADKQTKKKIESGQTYKHRLQFYVQSDYGFQDKSSLESVNLKTYDSKSDGIVAKCNIQTTLLPCGDLRLWHPASLNPYQNSMALHTFKFFLIDENAPYDSMAIETGFTSIRTDQYTSQDLCKTLLVNSQVFSINNVIECTDVAEVSNYNVEAYEGTLVMCQEPYNVHDLLNVTDKMGYLAVIYSPMLHELTCPLDNDDYMNAMQWHMNHPSFAGIYIGHLPENDRQKMKTIIAGWNRNVLIWETHPNNSVSMAETVESI